MELRFTNGATVNRVWGDSTTELVAGFQFEQHALLFAQAMLANEAMDCHYIVTNHNSGNLTIIRREAKAKAA